MPENKVPSIDELIKSGVLKKGTDKSFILRRIPIGIPAVDALFGGGLPIGRPILLYGAESTGKTLLAQYAAAAVQKTDRPLALLLDLERGYDQAWWEQSGVDPEKLLVSTPATAEQAIDIIRAMMSGSEELGIIILDSLAAMVPAPETDPEKSSLDKTIGLQAKVITLMYRQILGIMSNVVFIATNQMRESIGTHDSLSALPGGRAARHLSQIIVSTRREGWITEGKENRIGFHMEIGMRKNKTAAPIYEAATVDFLFKGQIDYMTSYLDEAIQRKLITGKPPWFNYKNKNYLGRPNLRQFFSDHPEEFKDLKKAIG